MQAFKEALKATTGFTRPAYIAGQSSDWQERCVDVPGTILMRGWLTLLRHRMGLSTQFRRSS